MNSVIEKSGTYKGFNYEVRAVNMGWRCGYVNLPDRLKGYFSYGETVNSLDVHGGITFIEDECIGFDCAHITDEYDESIMSDKYKEFNISHPRIAWEGSTVKDLTYVEKECKKLIDQLSELKTPYEEGFEAGQKAALKWLPIESAPKDGSLILLANSDWERKFAVGSWKLHREGENIEYFYYWDIPGIEEDYHADCDAPTDWLPLSALPPAQEVKDVE